MNSRRGLTLISVIFFFLGAAAESARAEIELTFYAHPGARVRGGWLLFPHAYIGLAGTLTDGEVVDEYVGFTAANPGPQLLFVTGRGVLLPPDGRYRHESTRGLSVPLTDAGYWAIQRRLEVWRSPLGSVYNLRSRNCITFVADMAEIAGLTAPIVLTLSPGRLLADLARLNPTSGEGSALSVHVASSPPSSK